MWSLFFGFSELIWGQLVFTIPKVVIPRQIRCCAFGIGRDRKGCCEKLALIRGLSKVRKQVGLVETLRPRYRYLYTRTLNQWNLSITFKSLICFTRLNTAILSPISPSIFVCLGCSRNQDSTQIKRGVVLLNKRTHCDTPSFKVYIWPTVKRREVI